MSIDAKKILHPECQAFNVGASGPDRFHDPIDDEAVFQSSRALSCGPHSFTDQTDRPTRFHSFADRPSLTKLSGVTIY